MITERTLKRWRKDALKSSEGVSSNTETEVFSTDTKTWKELQERILRMTQELLDLHLTREK